jgi:hypothetical protein
MTLQRDLKWARIVLLAADGRSTRSRLASPGVSNDPNFTAKAADVVGLYVARPRRPLCCA